MIKVIKTKWEDLYSWIDHFWWKNEVDIYLISLFLLVCLINIIDYGK